MNGFNSSKSSCANTCSLILLSLLCLFLGCNENKKTASHPGAEQTPSVSFEAPSGTVVPAVVPTEGPDGQTLLENLQTKYSSLKSYQDKAVLYLNYRLRGQFMQEPQPWSVAWDSNRLSSKIFNAQINGDGELLSCYVFDIDSGNLDNQHLLIPYDSQLPISQLYRDPIAKHFIGGYSELPLDESDLVSMPKLIPPQLSLLTGQARNPWLQNPTKVQRLADQNLPRKPGGTGASNEQACFVVRSLANGMTADIWIDKSDNSLVQMSLPLKLLAGEVITSPEVTDVELLARFHSARFDAQVPDDEFAILDRVDCKPVRKFVSLPESFPSELIGQEAPDFMLAMDNGRARTRLFFDGKITAFLWLAGQPSFASLKKLDEIAKEFQGKDFHIGGVYSDSELKMPGTGKFDPMDELAAVIQQVEIPVYYDRQLTASSRLKISAIPSIIVMDGDSKIQFSRALSDKTWAEDLTAVLKRVANGDDVATEMLTEYQRFLESYHQQVLTVSATDLIGRPQVSAKTVGSTNGATKSSIRLRPQQAWTNKSFKKSGNVLALGGNNAGNAHYAVFDGWRTIVELDSDGKIVTRKELELPQGEAVSLLRVGTSRGKTNLYALFSKLGKKIYLFDQAWNQVGIFPKQLEHEGIEDCRLADLNQDGISELVVAFKGKGVHLVDTATLESQPINKLIPNSLTAFSNDIVVAANNKIGRLKTGVTSVDETELGFKRVGAKGNLQLCGLGVTREGNWTAVGLDDSLKRVWALSIGPQFFECEVEPLAVTETSTGDLIWAIADNEDVIHLVAGSGKWLGDFQSESQIAGVALSASAENVNLVVANEAGVESWELNIQSSPMRAASGKARN